MYPSQICPEIPPTSVSFKYYVQHGCLFPSPQNWLEFLITDFRLEVILCTLSELSYWTVANKLLKMIKKKKKKRCLSSLIR